MIADLFTFLLFLFVQTHTSPSGAWDLLITKADTDIPYWNGPGADSEEKHEPVSDIDTAVVDSLKALDLERPIREADNRGRNWNAR